MNVTHIASLLNREGDVNFPLRQSNADKELNTIASPEE